MILSSISEIEKEFPNYKDDFLFGKNLTRMSKYPSGTRLMIQLF